MSTAFYGRSGEDDFLATFDDEASPEDMMADLLEYLDRKGFTSVEYLIGISTLYLENDIDDLCDKVKIQAFRWEE